MEKLTQKGEVELSVHFDDTLIYIREKNTCSGFLNRNGDEIIMSKQDKELHGFGIRNMVNKVCLSGSRTLLLSRGKHVGIRKQHFEWKMRRTNG